MKNEISDSKIETHEQKCFCGNPKWGFDCICDFLTNNPGNIEYLCEYCGLYFASTHRCNKCKASDDNE